MKRKPLAAVAALALCGALAGQSTPQVRPIDSAFLAAPRLTESSGVAPSSVIPGVFWTHNDSGNEPRLYAIDSAGRDLGLVRVLGATARDWEDLAAGPCVVAPGVCLYIADIGDNRARRSSVVVYRVREPQPPRGPWDTLRVARALDSLTLRFPDRPHDAEAFAVTCSGTALLVTKDRFGPAVLFRTTVGPGLAPRTLDRVGALAIRTSVLTGRQATGAAVSPDCRLLVVRTYVSLHLFRLRGDSLPEPLGPPGGVTIPEVEPQGEAVAFDGPDRLVLTSEGGTAGRGRLTRLRLVLPTR